MSWRPSPTFSSGRGSGRRSGSHRGSSLFESVRDFAATFRGGFIPISTEELEPTFPRLIERDLPYHQSRNKIHIKHRHMRSPLYKLLRRNWFHVFLRLPTKVSVFLLLLSWTVMIVVFAWAYYIVDRWDPNDDCGLRSIGNEFISFHGAFGFSLETATTVGYSLPGSSNALFEKCPSITTLIYLQMMVCMMFNAFLFAFFFARLARSETRAIQVVFSKKCVIRKTQRGNVVLQIQVYDVECGHGIVEAHVRLYALLKHKDVDGHPKMQQLRISSPNDETGSELFLNIPSVVTHEVDCYSPLFDATSTKYGRQCQQYRLSSGGLLLREVDSVNGGREEIQCIVCGETYGDFRRLRKHVKYNQLTEKHDSVPIKGSHQELSLDSIPKEPSRPSLDDLRNNLQLQELICVVEGIDPLTSGTFQALQSYMPCDIEWNSCFVPCVTSTTALDATFVDLKLFHETKQEGRSEALCDIREDDREQAFFAAKKGRKYGSEIV